MPTIKDRFRRLVHRIFASPTFAADGWKVEIAEDISKALTARGFTVQELSARSGLSAHFLRRVLRGDVNLKLDDLARIAHALNAEVTPPKVVLKKSAGGPA